MFSKLRNAIVYEIIDKLPYPAWIKVWRDGEDWPEMVWINTTYTSKEWFPDNPYKIGDKDYDAWPMDVAIDFRLVDHLAISNYPEPVERIERTPNSTNGPARVMTHKVAVRGKGAWYTYGYCKHI